MFALKLTFKQPRSVCALAAAFLLVVTAARTVALGEDGHDHGAITQTVLSEGQGPYCGLYCLYATMRMADQNVEIADLIKPQYLGSRKGSSVAEIIRAAQEHGMHATMADRLTSSDLRSSRHPLILHVKSAEASKEYDHYCLYLGTREGKAWLFDPLLGQRLLSYAELVRMWDGVGVLVAAKPADARSLLAARRTRLVLYGVMALAGIGLVHWITATRLRGAAPRSRKGLAGLSAVQAGGLLVAASLAGVSCHFVDAEGFLSHANATASVQQAYMGSFLPKIEASDVRRLAGGNAVFVDARYPGDYRAGHLDGAINIPVNATEVQRREALRRVNKDSRIVLYCQSAGCKFAETVAIKLVSDGFANVAIFTGGWQDWQSVNSKPRG